MNGTTWKFYTGAIEVWDAMLADCENAKKSIDMDQYIFHADEIGRKFLDIFLRKAKDGVRVRLVCDAMGSSEFMASGWPKVLSNAGVQVHFFNPISPWRLYNFTSWFFRDHKKILVIDSAIGYTGGVGINIEMSNWRDTHVCMTGPIVASMEKVFDRTLEMAIKGKFMSLGRGGLNGSDFRFVTNAPIIKIRPNLKLIRHHFMDAIMQARRFIYLTTPYFVPDLGFYRAVRDASERGVDVRLILPAGSDHRSIDLASDSYIALALKSGVKVYRYLGRMLHAKTAVVDDEWSSIGSTNLDNLSFRYNYEANVVSTNRDFTADLKNHFLGDISQSKEILSDSWSKRSNVSKILEAFTWPVHNFF